MKKIILASILASAMSTVAFADQFCGTIGTHYVGPHCIAGGACPDFVRLQFDLVTADGQRYDITSSTGALDDIANLKGQEVCVSGDYANGTINIDAILSQ
jgi:hypothetical protein